MATAPARPGLSRRPGGPTGSPWARPRHLVLRTTPPCLEAALDQLDRSGHAVDARDVEGLSPVLVRAPRCDARGPAPAARRPRAPGEGDVEPLPAPLFRCCSQTDNVGRPSSKPSPSSRPSPEGPRPADAGGGYADVVAAPLDRAQRHGELNAWRNTGRHKISLCQRNTRTALNPL